MQVSTGGAEYLSGPTVKDMVRRRAGARGVRPPRRQGATRSRSRCTPTTARRTSSTATCARSSRSRRSGSPRGREPAVPVAHVGRLGRRARGEPRRSRASCSRSAPRRSIVMEMEIGVVGGEEDGVANEINEKLYTTPEDALRTAEVARHRRERPLPARRDVRQRARRLQAGQRQAQAGDPQGDPGRGRRRRSARTSRSTWSSTAARARCSRRSARRSTTAS